MFLRFETLRHFIWQTRFFEKKIPIVKLCLRFESTQGTHHRIRWNMKESKVLKVAIIGVPNAGKSTLINEIVGRNVRVDISIFMYILLEVLEFIHYSWLLQVFAVSKKVHTTRCTAKAVLVQDDTQVVFLDTPGLVSLADSVK